MAPLHLTAAATPESVVSTEQVIVALIGGLVLVLVALIPVLATTAKREASTTTSSPPGPVATGISAEEAERLWNAIQEVKREQQRAAVWAASEHGGITAQIGEARRDLDALGDKFGRLRDRFHRHVGAPDHRTRGPDTSG